MTFAFRLSFDLIKVFVIFYGLQITASAQDIQCTDLNQRISECVRVEHHPSGPMFTSEWRKVKEKIPYKIEIKGARSGSFLVSGARLFLDRDQTWMIVRSNGVKVLLLSSNEKPPKVILRFREAGYAWQIRVTHQEVPVPIVGIATEGEMKLDLEIIRIK